MKKYAIFKTLPGKGTVMIILFAVLLLTILMIKGDKQGNYSQNLVRERVIFLGKDLGGLTKEEAGAAIESARSRLEREPVDAYIDPENKGVIPELLGYKVDISSTLKGVLEAGEGEEVSPVIKKINPEITMQDFPLAPLYQGNPEKNKFPFWLM